MLCVLTRAHTCSHGSVRGCLALTRLPTSMNTAAPELQRLRSLVVSLCRLEPWRRAAWLRGASFPPSQMAGPRRVRGPCGVSARPLPARPTSSHARCCACVSLSRLTCWAPSRWVVGLSSSSPLVEACAPACLWWALACLRTVPFRRCTTGVCPSAPSAYRFHLYSAFALRVEVLFCS